eukprot:3689100-Rhodomonas_salina.1
MVLSFTPVGGKDTLLNFGAVAGCDDVKTHLHVIAYAHRGQYLGYKLCTIPYAPLGPTRVPARCRELKIIILHDFRKTVFSLKQKSANKRTFFCKCAPS